MNDADLLAESIKELGKMVSCCLHVYKRWKEKGTHVKARFLSSKEFGNLS